MVIGPGQLAACPRCRADKPAGSNPICPLQPTHVRAARARGGVITALVWTSWLWQVRLGSCRLVACRSSVVCNSIARILQWFPGAQSATATHRRCTHLWMPHRVTADSPLRYTCGTWVHPADYWLCDVGCVLRAAGDNLSAVFPGAAVSLGGFHLTAKQVCTCCCLKSSPVRCTSPLLAQKSCLRQHSRVRPGYKPLRLSLECQFV
jgi:hypothetical protein